MDGPPHNLLSFPTPHKYLRPEIPPSEPGGAYDSPENVPANHMTQSRTQVVQAPFQLLTSLILNSIPTTHQATQEILSNQNSFGDDLNRLWCLSSNHEVTIAKGPHFLTSPLYLLTLPDDVNAKSTWYRQHLDLKLWGSSRSSLELSFCLRFCFCLHVKYVTSKGHGLFEESLRDKLACTALVENQIKYPGWGWKFT